MKVNLTIFAAFLCFISIVGTTYATTNPSAKKVDYKFKKTISREVLENYLTPVPS